MKIAYFYPEKLPAKNARSISIINTSCALSIICDTTLIYEKSQNKKDIKEFYSLNSQNLNFLPLSKKFIIRSNKIFNFNLKKILQKYNFDIFYVRHLKMAKFLIENKSENSKIIFECHEIFSKNNSKVKYLEEFIIKNSDGLVFINDTLKEVFTEYFNLSKKLKKTIHNGCNFKFEYIKKDLSKIDEIYYIGNFYPWKGIDFAIKAMTYLPELKLKIIGSGNRLAELQNLTKKLKLNNVEFLGYKPQKEIKEILKKAKLTIIPNTKSDYSYFSTPIKLYEYLSASCIVISSDMPTIKEIIKDKKNGFLFETGNLNSYIETIKTILTYPEDKLLKISKNAYEISKQFTWKNRAKEILEFSKEILNEKN